MSPPPEIPPELRRAGEGERGIREARARAARGDARHRLMQVSAIGTEFAVAVVGGGVLGWLLDLLLGTEPWLLLAGCLLGLVWGFIRFIRTGLALAGSSGAEADRETTDAGR